MEHFPSHKVNITLLPKADKDNIRKKKYRPLYLINVDTIVDRKISRLTPTIHKIDNIP